MKTEDFTKQQVSAGIAATICAVLICVAGPAAAQSLLPTNVSVKNSSTTNRSLLSKSVTGVLTPTPNNPLVAGTTNNFTSTSSGSTDAGRLTYSGCRFNWSKIRQASGLFTFSKGAELAPKCVATIVSSNPSTGAYSVKFEIKP